MPLTPVDIANFVFRDADMRQAGVYIRLHDSASPLSTFLLGLDVLIRGLAKMLGSPVDLSSVNASDFDMCAGLMRQTLDLYPVIVQHTSSDMVAGRIVDIADAYKGKLTSGGGLEEYGVVVKQHRIVIRFVHDPK